MKPEEDTLNFNNLKEKKRKNVINITYLYI